MPKNNQETPTKRGLVTLVLISLSIFVGLSLGTYSPTDPVLVSYPLGQSKNVMGPVGANIADFLLTFFGGVAWLVPILLCFAALSEYSFFQKFFPSKLYLGIGTALVILGLSMILTFFGSGSTGAGGLFGFYCQKIVLQWFGMGGVILIALVLILSGIMLGTNLDLSMISALFKKKRDAALDLKPVKIGAKSINFKESISLAQSQTQPELPKIAEPPSLTKKKTKQENEKNKTIDFEIQPKVEGTYSLPPLDLLQDPPEYEVEVDEESYYQNAQVLEQKLLDFGVAGKVVEICPGPVVTMYEYSPAPGVKINKVTSLQDDIALALKSHSIRIVAPIPGKSVIGIELANQKRQVVYLKEILDTELFRRKTWKLPLALGKDVVGEPVLTDLAKMPHLLIAGATGTGKSVGLNSMICSLLYKHVPQKLRLLMIDPKRIELSLYDGIPHLLHPVVSEPKEATKALRWAVQEMERRYGLLESFGARNIENYNSKIKANDSEEGTQPLPYLVIIIDELADLMMVSSKEVEAAIARLAQMARAAGIHLIVATQRPSVDVLTGLIKANFPARLSFKVSSKVDSRTILDTTGAERLLGMGDMLFLPPATSTLERIHGAFCSESEIKMITDFWRKQGSPEYDLSVTQIEDEQSSNDKNSSKSDYSDELYDQAIDLVTQSGQASISMIQRRLRVGYNRAARMIEQMERDGIVSPADSMGRRQVLVRGYED